MVVKSTNDPLEWIVWLPAGKVVSPCDILYQTIELLEIKVQNIQGTPSYEGPWKVFLNLLCYDPRGSGLPNDS